MRCLKKPVVGIAAFVALLAGCGQDANKYAPPPPPDVTVSQPVERVVTNSANYTGNTVAFFTVDLRARVKGFLQSINFQVGARTRVKKDDLLFVIEPEPYQAQVEQCKGELQAKEAQYKASVDALAIKEEMYAKNAASKLEVISATDARDTTQAQIAVAKAALDQAQINLGYTHINAPINGLISRNLVDVGNLVGAGEETLLTTLVQDDPMYAYFNVSERDLLTYRAMLRTVQAAGKPVKETVYLGLATDDAFPHEGVIDFVDNKLDPDTGTIQVRGRFPNPDGVLIAGLFVRIRLPYSQARALLTPDVALGDDQAGKFLLVVNDKNIVEIRRVQVGALQDGMRVISEGLKGGEWVVVNGIQRALPGAQVNPQREKLDTPAPAPAPPSKK